jgi:uncharacterized protein
VESDWIDRTIAVGDELRLLISGPWPRRVMTTLPQATCQRVPPCWIPAEQHNQASVGVYADVIAGGAISRDNRGTLA